MPPRVVITGMGWVTPLGHDVASVWSRLLEGKTGVGPITRFEAGTWSTNFAAEVRDLKLEDFLDDTAPHREAGLNTQFALGAAAQAWRQAGLDGFKGLNRRRMGIYLGAGEGSLDYGPYFGTNLEGWN